MIIASELAAPLRITSGPAIQHAGDLAAVLSVAGRGRGALPRRDPPDGPAGRGDALHGHGGLPGRRRGRQGSGGDRHPAGDPAVHPGRCHHPGRAAAGAAARPLRLHRATWTSTHADELVAIAGPLGPAARRPDRPRTAPPRSPAGPAGTPRIANRLLRRVRDYAQVQGGRRRRPGDRPRGAGRSTRSTSWAWTAWTAASSTPCAGGSGVARWGCPRWPSRSGRSARPSRRSPSRSWSAPGCWPARRAAGSPPPAAWQHLGLAAPRGSEAALALDLFGEPDDLDESDERGG